MSQASPPIVPPWATSLLQGPRNDSTSSTPSKGKSPALHSATPGSTLAAPASRPTVRITSTPTSASTSTSTSTSTPKPNPKPKRNQNRETHDDPSRSPEPARVVSDLAPPPSDQASGAGPGPIHVAPPLAVSKPPVGATDASKSSFSGSSRIQSLQKQWEHNHSDTPSTSADPSKSVAITGDVGRRTFNTEHRTSTRPLVDVPSSSSSDESDIPSQLPTVASRRLIRNHPGQNGFRVLSGPNRKRSPGDPAPGLPSYKRRHTESAAGVEETTLSSLTLLKNEQDRVPSIVPPRQEVQPASTLTARAPGPQNPASGGATRPTFIPISRTNEPLTSSSESESDLEDEVEDKVDDEVEDEDGDKDVDSDEGEEAEDGDVDEDEDMTLMDQTTPQSQDEGYSADRSGIFLPGVKTRGAKTSSHPEPLLLTTDGDRPYNMWKHPGDGSLVSTNGALLPAGYTPYHDPDNPDLEWICPVRDCRNLLGGVTRLGAHMNAKHHHSTFNDNGDGTLTWVGRYTNQPGRPSVPIVVSTNPPGPDEPPPVQPTVPAYIAQEKKRAKKLARLRLSSRKHAPKNKKSKSKSRISAAMTDDSAPGKLLPRKTSVIEYLHQHFGPELQLPDKGGSQMELLQLPRQRDLPPRWGLHYRFHTWGAPPVFSVALYLTGDVARDGRCQVCTAGDGIWRQCVVAPKGASAGLRERLKGTCAGCLFRSNNRRHRNICSFLVGKLVADDLADREVLAEPIPVDDVPTPTPAPAPAPATGAALALSAAEPAGSARPIRSTRLARLERSSTDVTTGAAAAASSAAVVAASRPTRLKSSPKPSWTDSIINPGAPVITADVLEMEDWEVAPGRIRDNAESAADNVAFSNSYLTSNRAIPVSNDVSFNVVVLKPGSSTQLAAEDDKMRLCSLATGKVRVRMDGVDEFVMGPNGMFKVRSGVGCSVQNRLYIDAVLHITTITDD
ncbi:hypothetical protein SODALDRAFT_329695 [Sodiomyces alkalinus F11]|uniref:Uncharacterized protein n=1 Tax=Sodiomyces alkalinus (strain CBS 110278 / VKM F-3762 / F11) TaxID=1314773 RepID=A0A3N2PJU3_SODAK|nr:hypothetical protein SODALDRAFT_329695 [Sodiomyces alkalinus F11]ROT34586.1 hypothetical protein SODALDRAFT_329695 [Sodiomyces alkalinus F11]